MKKNLSAIKKEIIENLKNTYCRLKPSRIAGVGVFAIRDIPKGINPFNETKQKNWYELKTSDFKNFDKDLLKMIDNFFVIEKDDSVLVPKYGLNGMDISFYINHSKSPNVKTIDEGFNFITLRKIKKGEELTVSYGTYDWKFK